MLPAQKPPSGAVAKRSLAVQSDVRRLVAAGLSAVELTSFVSPKWVPQLADADELVAQLGPLPGRHPVLVPNERGLERALACGVKEIAVFASATESFAQRNLNRTLSESLELFAPVVSRAVEAGLPVRGYVSMCFGDPWEGAVPVAQDRKSTRLNSSHLGISCAVFCLK